MTKSPYPLLDWIMVGPLLAFANIHFGSPLPEVYVALAIAVSRHISCACMYSEASDNRPSEKQTTSIIIMDKSHAPGLPQLTLL